MTLATEDRVLSDGDEAGTAPGDRKFRPDVQGLRAIAILLVVLFHAGVPGIGGGYVGVDVFFVISGFVITGVLLRERASGTGTSILAFYGRRSRRIIPAATLVIIVTVIAAVYILGSNAGNQTAVDGQWASVFLANVHFAASSTNYLASQRPPSPLQNFWSLAVEEQFYLVYPTLFLFTARVFRKVSFTARLTVLLSLIMIGSYSLSIFMTANNPARAFFSPFTRAWELALGAFVAVATDYFRRTPSPISAMLSWAGLAAILFAAFDFTAATQYPGSLVAVPVLGAALIIIGGATRPRWGVESLLRKRPFQLLGLISYSLYLWHWPILTIATQEQNKTSLPVGQSLMWILLSLIFAIVTYLVLENPVRHARSLVSSKWRSVLMGGLLVLASLVVTTFGAGASPGADGSALALARAASGSSCPQPSKENLSFLRALLGSAATPSTTTPSTVPSQILVVGDSTACTLLPGLVAIAPMFDAQVEDAAVIGCGIVSGQIAPYYYEGVNVEEYTNDCQSKALRAEKQGLATGKPNIILWASSFERDSIVIQTSTGEQTVTKGTPEWYAVMRRRIEERLRLLKASGATVVMLLQPPQVNIGSPKSPTTSDEDYERLNGLLKQIAEQDPSQIKVVDLAARVCPSGPPCPSIVDGITVRPDDMHYSSTSSLWVAQWLMPRILEAAKP